ncbi:MAG: RNA polymerase sigma factor, partial [Phycisphaerales bacterium]|nr:RNA polymerase sigma factor [Phycisphaerales bacterium]
MASRACDGDRAAFAEIIARHGTSVFSFLARRVETVQDAEDVFQATCLRAWTRMEEFDPRRGSLLCWLLVIAGSQARDAARASRRWRRAASC